MPGAKFSFIHMTVKLTNGQLTWEPIWFFIKITRTFYDKNQTIRKKKIVKLQEGIRYLTVFFIVFFTCFIFSQKNFLLFLFYISIFSKIFKNKIFKKNTILIKKKKKNLNDIDKNITNMMYEVFKNSLAKLDKVSFERSFCIKFWLLY